jgi:hypothetical protein
MSFASTVGSAHLSRFVVLLTTLALAGGSLAVTTGVVVNASTRVQPRASGELDCNGLSPAQKSVKMTMVCADPRTNRQERFEDNGHYIGHDEPTVRFVSTKPGSGDQFTITEVLGTDPSALPTVAHPGSDNTHYFELSVAPWFSINLCDPQSAPQLPCTPQSDANAPHGKYPGGGAAFTELQFYPPGFAPFEDAVSCDNTHWCSALNIDSLECAANGVCNNNCIEPVNFAYIQTDGVPTGPPSPQLTNHATFTPNRRTLLMNPGDTVTISMSNVSIGGDAHALKVVETDHTTGQSGFMIASANNGFMNTSIADCTGTPFNFQPEYNTAAPANILPWGDGPYDINSEFEIGHFEPCTSVNTQATFRDGPFTDTYFKNCVSPYESAKDSGKNSEPNDSPCFRKGDTHGGTVAPNEVTGCAVFFDAVGDLDYDGNDYRRDWPDSTTPDNFPSTFVQYQPTSHSQGYESIQLETDMAATESVCNLANGDGCVMPPPGPGHFYPFWTLAKIGGRCAWEFGQMRNGKDFGGDKQYGKVTAKTFGAFAGPIQPNPSTCAAP